MIPIYGIAKHESSVTPLLSVAGSRASKDTNTYEAVKNQLKSVLFPPPEHIIPKFPRTIQEAVGILLSDLSLKDKANIANMEEDELFRLLPNLGRHIREKFGLWEEGSELLRSCCSFIEMDSLNADDASAIIITRLWRRLKETHALRVV